MNLTKQDLKLYKELLLKKKDEISKGIEHIAKDSLNKSQRDAAGDLSGYSLHMADVATDNYDREFSLGLATNEQKLLNRINDALERIEEKTYGICELCQKKISKGRLKVVPYVEYCIPCQEKQEKKRK